MLPEVSASSSSPMQTLAVGFSPPPTTDVPAILQGSNFDRSPLTRRHEVLQAMTSSIESLGLRGLASEGGDGIVGGDGVTPILEGGLGPEDVPHAVAREQQLVAVERAADAYLQRRESSSSG